MRRKVAAAGFFSPRVTARSNAEIYGEHQRDGVRRHLVHVVIGHVGDPRPRALAAATSILSRPTPIRWTIFRSHGAAMTAALTCAQHVMIAATSCSAANAAMDWMACKSAAGFNVPGSYIIPARFVPDPQALHIRLSLNGDVMQDEGTDDMIFGVAADRVRLGAHRTAARRCPADRFALGQRHPLRPFPGRRRRGHRRDRRLGRNAADHLHRRSEAVTNLSVALMSARAPIDWTGCTTLFIPKCKGPEAHDEAQRRTWGGWLWEFRC